MWKRKDRTGWQPWCAVGLMEKKGVITLIDGPQRPRQLRSIPDRTSLTGPNGLESHKTLVLELFILTETRGSTLASKATIRCVEKFFSLIFPERPIEAVSNWASKIVDGAA